VNQGTHGKAPQGAEGCRHRLLLETKQITHLSPFLGRNYLKRGETEVGLTDQNRAIPGYSGVKTKYLFFHHETQRENLLFDCGFGPRGENISWTLARVGRLGPRKAG
jgi:hypothetical protein